MAENQAKVLWTGEKIARAKTGRARKKYCPCSGKKKLKGN